MPKYIHQNERKMNMRDELNWGEEDQLFLAGSTGNGGTKGHGVKYITKL